jgi:hypothetical protein
MVGRLFDLLLKGSVLLVDVHVVAFGKIIRHKNVGVSVVVQIGCHKTECITEIARYTCFLPDLPEFSLFIGIQFIQEERCE